MGRRLAGARVMAGMTTRQMASAVERSVSAVRGYERGINEPSGRVLAGWARTTGHSIEWLLTGVEEKRPASQGTVHPGVEQLAINKVLRARHHITDEEIARVRTIIVPWPIPDEQTAVDAVVLLRRIQPS